MTDTVQTHSGYVPVEGGELYYEVTGSGPALVLIHAGVANLRQWDEQLPAFARHYRVICYDTRGFGQTRTTETSFSNRQDLYDLLRHLGVKRAAVLGNSRGGQIATDFTLEHPEMVTALIPVAAGMSGFSGEGLAFPAVETEQEAAMEEAWEKRDLVRLGDLQEHVWADGPRETPGRAAPEVRTRLRTWIDEINNRQEPEPTARPLDPPAAGRLGEIRVPTLIILGDLDETAVLYMADAMEQGIAGARKVVLPGVAHMVNMEKPEEFTRLVLDFLAGVPEMAPTSGAG